MGKAIVAYETFAEGRVGKGTSKAALNVLLTATGIGAASKGVQGGRIAYLVSRTEAGVIKSSWRAVSAGTPIFISDFSKEVGKIPGKVLALPGRLVEALPALSALKKEAISIAKIQLEITKVSERLAQANEKLKTMMVGRKNVSEIKGLKDKTAKELAKFTGEDLKEIGLSTKGSIEDYLKYRDALQGVEDLKSTLEALKFQEKLTKISPELLQVSSLEGGKLDQFIAKFNETHPEGFKDKAFTIVKRGAKEVVALDEAGKLKKYVINKNTAESVLKEIKKADEVPKEGINSYELRQECLRMSEGQISTHEAYTYGDVPEGGKGMWEYLRDPNHWLPERRAFHNKIFHQESDAALQLSEKLGDTESTMHLLRGNTASGKSHYLPNNEPFRRALNEEGKVPGVMNPDNYKKQILEHEIGEGVKPLSSDQVYREAHALMDNVVDDVRIKNTKASEVWDQRFAKLKDITEKIAEAKNQEKKISIDLDVPLETSCLRVLNRKQISSAPRTNFNVVADGYKTIRKERGNIIELVKKKNTISDYVLYVSDKDGRPIKVFEKKNGVLGNVYDESLMNEALSDKTAPVIEKVRTTVIDHVYIKTVEPSLRPGVEKFKRKTPMTLEQAMEENARSFL